MASLIDLERIPLLNTEERGVLACMQQNFAADLMVRHDLKISNFTKLLLHTREGKDQLVESVALKRTY